MSKERGQQAREKFQGWIAEMKAKASPNWLDYWHGGKLSPKKIASELGFDSSAFKKSRNEKLFDMLNVLQQELSIQGIYQQRQTLPEEGLNLENNKNHVVTTKDEILDSVKVRDLKAINRRLQAENEKLLGEVAKLSEFKEVLIEMGLWK